MRHRILSKAASQTDQVTSLMEIHLSMINYRMAQTSNRTNAIMRRLLEREGFTYVGRVTLPDGDHRRAYHKVNPKGGI